MRADASADDLLPLPPATFHILMAVAEEDRHGYAIIQDIATRTDGALRLSAGTLYRSLQRMVEQGLIDETAERPAPDDDDERRRYYRITAFGRTVARAETRRLQELTRASRTSSYAALLRCYPASFREEYGGEMRAIFARQWRQARGSGGRAALLLAALVDTLRHAPAAHADILAQDLHTSWQTIRRAPALSLTVVAVTAIGIGATTAAFAVADHVLIRPLPYHEPDRLVKIWQHWPGPGDGRSEASPANFRDWRDHATSFERIAGYEFRSRNFAGHGEPARLEGVAVTGDLFATLGVPPLVGRTITADDDRDAAARTVVLSERFWRARFGADPAIVGQPVMLDDSAHVVIGVMPATFEFPTRLVDFWVPLALRPDQYVYGNPFIHTVARLEHGVSRDQAHAEVQAIARAAARADSRVNPTVSAIVITMRDEVAPQARLLLWILLAAAASQLVLACTNLANLLLTRGLSRQHELAVRAALGANRHRLTRQLCTENVVLATVGGAIAIGIAAAGIPTLVRLVPTTLPAAAAPAIDLRLMTAALIATFACAIGFGVMPALRIARHSEPQALHAGARAGTSRRTTRLRAGLVIAQVSMSVLLVVASGLLLRAMVTVQNTDPGFRPDGVLTMRTTLTVQRYESGSRRDQFFARVIDGVRALPGVTSAAYTSGLPMLDRGRGWFIRVPGDEALPQEQRIASLHFVTPRFFDTMGIPLRGGRDLADTDSQTSAPVAVVNEALARRYWPAQDALGRQFTLRGKDWTIVGVVGDVRISGLERPSAPQIYLAASQMPDRGLSTYVPRDLVVKTGGPMAALVPAIRAIIASADPLQPISDIQALAEIVGAETAPRRVQVQVLAAFAVIAFLLAGIGLHGLLAYNVSQGAREIGIRIALGARRHTIVNMIVRRGLLLAVAGTLVGGVLALAAGRWLEALLAGIGPADLLSFAGAAVLAVVMSAAGSLLPALRAVRVDPLQVIRSE